VTECGAAAMRRRILAPLVAILLLASAPSAQAQALAAQDPYRRLQSSLSGDQLGHLRRSQRAFDEAARGICRVGRSPGQTSVDCLREKAALRRALLDRLTVVSAGRLKIEPRLMTASRIHAADDDEDRAPGWIAMDAVPVLTGAPASTAAAFAAEMRRRLELNAPLIRGRDDMVGSLTRTFAVATLTPRFVSLLVTESVETGTRVPDRDIAINFDIALGRPVRLDDIFDLSDAFRGAVLSAIEPELQFPQAFPALRDDILAGNGDVRWIFAPDKATVAWSAIFSGPPESIDLPSSLLRPFLRKDSPWRP
jgi:hypothetical protein